MNSFWSRLATAGLLLAAGCRAHPAAPAIYTAEQAAHGKDIYAGMCVSCHAGMGNHTGPVFRAHWGGHSVNELYRYVSENMPKNDPGTLSSEDCAAVIAYLLQLNGMAAGSTALPTDSVALKPLLIDTTAATP